MDRAEYFQCEIINRERSKRGRKIKIKEDQLKMMEGKKEGGRRRELKKNTHKTEPD